MELIKDDIAYATTYTWTTQTEEDKNLTFLLLSTLELFANPSDYFCVPKIKLVSPSPH